MSIFIHNILDTVCRLLHLCRNDTSSVEKVTYLLNAYKLEYIPKPGHNLNWNDVHFTFNEFLVITYINQVVSLYDLWNDKLNVSRSRP